MSSITSPAPRGANLKTILIIDDDVPFAATLAIGLEANGYRKVFEQQGLGLGLTLVHRLVQHLGGEFDFESEAGKGTTSRITLPIATD